MQNESEFKPHDAIDLTNQDNVFLALEELGIAHMQHVWVRENAPEHEDAAAVEAQAHEFREDLEGLFLGAGGPERVVPNGWAGTRLANHLRTALADRLGFKALRDDRTVVGAALEAYLSDIEALTRLDAVKKAEGGKLDPRLYINFMAAWSGVFCGSADALSLPAELKAQTR